MPRSGLRGDGLESLRSWVVGFGFWGFRVLVKFRVSG